MAHTDVSSCVLSIVGSFASGLDVFKKLREKKKRRRRSRRDGRECDARVEEEEMRLSRSLRQGPEDIGREYARNLYAVGNGFGVGDGRCCSEALTRQPGNDHHANEVDSPGTSKLGRDPAEAEHRTGGHHLVVPRRGQAKRRAA